MSRETASPSMNMMRSTAPTMQAVPVPSKISMSALYDDHNNGQENNTSSFRCISPSIELLRKTQSTQGKHFL